jgi:prepilin-type N-terminal cleavage/methylation domain-containing protein
MTINEPRVMRKDRGFTIVELLIVIVVIAILAVIVIVAYNGVQNRSKSSSSRSTAQAVQSKSEAYYVENGAYPTLLANLTTAASNTSYYLGGITFSATDPTSASTTNTVSYYTCTGGGNKIGYYDYAGGAVAYTYTMPANSLSTCARTAS